MPQHDEKIINLQGEWRVEIDTQDAGINDRWFSRPLSGSGFHLPGTCAEHHLGERNTLAPGLTKEAVQCLRTEYTYQGAAWYQTEIHLTDVEAESDIILFLERVMGETQVWIDDLAISKQDSLSIPHQFDITPYVSDGQRHQLTLRIDNRDIHNIGEWPSARTDQTQTIWNGVIGKIELHIRNTYTLNSLLISMDNRSRKVTLNISKPKAIADWQNIVLTLTINDLNGHYIQQEILSTQTPKNQPTITTSFILNDDIVLWDEFTPQLYQVVVTINDLSHPSNTAKITQTTGFRQISTHDGLLKINGIQRFLRGNIDCCIYPLTGYPPTTEVEWSHIFQQLKQYGINHVRFHSWCPPEAAFTCADRQGMYLQIEGPLWMDNWMDFPVGKYPDHYHWLPEEAERIIRAWSIHPSFCIFSNGNELNGDFQLLQDIIQRLRNLQPQIIYTLTSNWDRQMTKEDDIFIAQSSAGIGVRGQYFLDQLVETTTLNFSTGVQMQTLPVISHEVGQYVVYPNVAEIPCYTGSLIPVNLQRIRDDLEQNNLLPYLNDFINSSGKMALYLYKMEIEAALRTRNMAGIQLLSLHDFPGQSTATVGILDAFYTSKNIIATEAFRHFCCETVPLVMMPTLFYTSDDSFNAELQIAHYSASALHQVTLRVQITNEKQHVIFTEDFAIDEVPVGLLKENLSLQVTPFRTLIGRQSLQVKAELLNTPYQNQWDIWVYGQEEPCSFPPSVTLCREWSPSVEERLQKGEHVLLLPTPAQVKQLASSTWFPVFWSPVHFASKDPCGMVINNQHPLFSRYFPCENHATLEWKALLENSFAMNIDSLEQCAPLTLLTPNFFHNHKNTHLFECCVGEGRLMVCTFNLEVDSLISKPFQNALYNYLASADFTPEICLSMPEIRGLFTSSDPEKITRTDLAIGKPAQTDSMKSLNYGPLRGNDGNPSTAWIAADAEVGHYWQVDFESILHITATQVVFNENAVYTYVIQHSRNGIDWDIAVNKTNQIVPQQTHDDEFSVNARFLRIIYQGLSNGIWAGHRQFSAYGPEITTQQI